MLQPILQVMEGYRVSYIKGNDEALSSPVVSFGYGVEALLASSIPYLQSNLSLVESNNVFLEVDAYGGDVCF